MVKPIIHIGYHKTATSFLQKQVFSDSRFFVLPWGQQAGHSIEHFALEHPERFDPAQIRREFLEKCGVDNTKIPVISHEGLSGNPINGRYHLDRVAERLHQTFPDAHIVIGVREQRAALVSLYYQQIRQGGSKKVEDFLPQPQHRIGFRPTVRLDHFEYDLTYCLFRKYWPAEDILVMPMELLRLDATAYLDRLFGNLNLSAPTDIRMEKVNEKRLPITMRTERILNRFIHTPDPRPSTFGDYPVAYQLKSRFLSAMDRMTMLGRFNAQDKKIKTYIHDRIGDHFVASNKALSKEIDMDLDALGYFNTSQN